MDPNAEYEPPIPDADLATGVPTPFLVGGLAIGSAALGGLFVWIGSHFRK